MVCAARRATGSRRSRAEIGGTAVTCDVTSAESVAGLAAAVGDTPARAGQQRRRRVRARRRSPRPTPTTGGGCTTSTCSACSTSPRRCCPRCAPSGDGLIVNVGSTAGRIAYEGGGGYTAAKHGTQVVTETLRLELVGEPIRISEIAPGMVRTDEFAMVRFERRPGRAPTRCTPASRPAGGRGRRRRDRLDRHPPLAREHRRAGDQAARPGRPAQGAPGVRARRASDPWDRVSDRAPHRDRLQPMQTIGLVGGMSWESSEVYYRDLNLGVRNRLGGLSSPKLVLSTVDFAEVTALEDEERWQQIGELLADAARGVERAGADFLLLCTTTFHKVADQVEAAVDLPLLHLGRRGRRGGAGPGRDEGRLHRHHGRDVGRLLHRPAGPARPRDRRPRRAPPRHAQQRDLRRAGARPGRRRDPASRARRDRGAVGRRRRRRAARLHRARAADHAGRLRAPGLPLHHPARDRRPRPRARATERSGRPAQQQVGQRALVVAQLLLRAR